MLKFTDQRFLKTSLVMVVLLPGILANANAEESGWNRIGLEFGAIQQNYNNVQIPSDSGTRFSLNDFTGTNALSFYRLELSYDLNAEQQLRILYAPLRYTKNTVLDTTINFDGSTFTAGKNTAGTYQFNSYRISYRYKFLNNPEWQWYVGGTLKVRDAEIALQQDTASANNANIGLVPLVNLYGEYHPTDNWQVTFDFDGLVGPQGYALDFGVKAEYKLDKNWYLGGGLRVLDGGADNDTIYNFAQFNYTFISTGYRF